MNSLTFLFLLMFVSSIHCRMVSFHGHQRNEDMERSRNMDKEKNVMEHQNAEMSEAQDNLCSEEAAEARRKSNDDQCSDCEKSCPEEDETVDEDQDSDKDLKQEGIKKLFTILIEELQNIKSKSSMLTEELEKIKSKTGQLTDALKETLQEDPKVLYKEGKGFFDFLDFFSSATTTEAPPDKPKAGPVSRKDIPDGFHVLPDEDLDSDPTPVSSHFAAGRRPYRKL